ncbi:glycosylated lysosomal membrane protein [Brachionichthys hirsutus]|uniref:glycosylated lysosomal membrane protein n=1 Tax=Brachionichthys hirsutus TaxID=412623 RepID=UPI0036049C40
MAAPERRQRGGVSSAILLFSAFSSCFSLFSGRDAFKRKLLVEMNPGSSSPPPDFDLLHVRAVGDNDTLHFLFCSQGAPTLLLVHTNTTASTVAVNWTRFEDRNHSGGLQVEPESSILHSTAVIFSRLLEYDDANNTAEPQTDFFPAYDLQDVSWSRLNLSGPNALLCGAVANGSFCLQLSVFETEGRGQALPRLLHTANSSQLNVRLDGVLPRSSHSRFLLELQAVGGAYPPSRVEAHRSIDDEFTPTIFKVSLWVPSENSSSDVLGFLQWKPVAYRQPASALEDATPCRNSAPLPQSGEAVKAASGLVRAFYTQPEAFGLNVSFGLAGEPFYNSTGFLSWTALLGSGLPPVDSISPLVLSMMVFGLGTPTLLLLMGGIYVAVRKRPVTVAYEPVS